MSTILQNALWVLGIYNMGTFFLMAVDKSQAKNKGRRVPERTLLWLTFLGGGLGAFLGSRVFHHKTKKAPFPLVLPLGAIITIGLGVLLVVFL